MRDFQLTVSPLPDELFYSFIARAALSFGTSIGKYWKGFTGKNSINPFFFRYPDLVADPEMWIVHSLLKYYLPVLPEDKQQEVLQNTLAGECITDSLIYGRVPDLVKKGFSFCPECAKNQFEKYGICYPVTEHQTEGISACRIHGCRLASSPKANPEITDLGSPVPAEKDEFSISLLLPKIVGKDLNILGPLYQNLLERFSEQDPRQKRNSFIDFVNSRCGSGAPLKFQHLRSLTGGAGDRVHPYYHLKIWAAFDIDDPFGKLSNTENETRICRNPLCRSSQTVRLGYNYGSDDYWRCSKCGMVYSEKNIVQLGRKGAQLLKEKREQDQKFYLKTAEDFGVSYPTLSRLLKNPEKLDLKISGWRKEALEYGTFGKLRNENRNLFNNLHRYDQEWMEANLDKIPREAGLKNPHKTKYSDDELLELAKEKYKELADDNVWITLNKILAPFTGTVNKDRIKKQYPETYRFASEHSESVYDSWIRRVKRFMDEWTGPGRPELKDAKKILGTSPKMTAAFRLLNGED